MVQVTDRVKARKFECPNYSDLTYHIKLINNYLINIKYLFVYGYNIGTCLWLPRETHTSHLILDSEA